MAPVHMMDGGVAETVGEELDAESESITERQDEEAKVSALFQIGHSYCQTGLPLLAFVLLFISLLYILPSKRHLHAYTSSGLNVVVVER